MREVNLQTKCMSLISPLSMHQLAWASSTSHCWWKVGDNILLCKWHHAPSAFLDIFFLVAVGLELTPGVIIGWYTTVWWEKRKYLEQVYKCWCVWVDPRRWLVETNDLATRWLYPPTSDRLKWDCKLSTEAASYLVSVSKPPAGAKQSPPSQNSVKNNVTAKVLTFLLRSHPRVWN